MHNLIYELKDKLPKKDWERLLELTPKSYIGNANVMAVVKDFWKR